MKTSYKQFKKKQMNAKPTYQELENQIAELKKQNEMHRLNFSIQSDEMKKRADELIKAKEITEESEVHFKELYNNINDAVFYQDSATGNIISANETAKRIYGYSDDEFKRMGVKQLNNENNILKIEKRRKTLLEKGFVNFESVHITKGGKFIPVEAKVKIIDDKSYISVARDITERKKAEQALKESEEKYRRLSENAQDMIYRMSLPDGKYEYISPASINICEYTPKEIYNTPLFLSKIIHPDFIDYFKTAWSKLIKGEMSPTYEYKIITKTGKEKWLHQRNVLIKDKLNNPIAMEGIVTDITDRKKAEQALKESEAQLRELNATKDKFFSIISHDLKNPFNSILGFSQLLIKKIQDKDFERIEEFAGNIENSSHRAMNLLTNLMEWSRSQTGKMEFNPVKVDVVELINENAELLNYSALQKSITISKKLPGNAQVSGDKDMISTILRNLISNSIKFTHPGGTIVISAEQKQNELIICVSDSGVGIEKENITKLFRIEESISTPGTQQEKGSGLGLILCKEFVEKHGGKIWVESDPDSPDSYRGQEGKGSDFKFTLPFNKS